MNSLLGFMLLLFAGILYATNDILIRVIASEISTYHQLIIRGIGGLAFALIITFMTKTQWTFGKAEKKYIIFFSLGFPLTVLFFTIGIIFAKIAAVIFAFYAASFLMSLSLGILFFKEKFSLGKIIGLVSVLIGLIFLTFPFSPKDINIGFIAGLIGGSINPITNSFSKHFKGKIKPSLLMICQMIGLIILGVILLFGTKSTIIPHMSFPILATALISGVLLVCTVYCTIVGFQNFDLHLGTIVTSTELVFAPFAAFLVFKEQLTSLQIIGGLFITLAIIIPHLTSIKKGDN